ncbi:MAG: hypothetical protein WA324_11320 [Bryobacteraceae bacterium]
MNETADVKRKIRQVLEDVSSDQQSIDEALDRIMEAIDPLQQLAREELERYRSTFAELAK